MANQRFKCRASAEIGYVDATKVILPKTPLMHYRLVWLVPRFSTNPTSSLTGIRIAIQGAPDEDKRSLARGANGFCRYIVPESVTGERRIHEVCLLRLNRAIKGAPVGYDGCSIDINCGRTGGYLYLIWKSCCI